MPESAASAMLSERVWYASAAATKKIEPTMKRAFSESRKQISSAISSGLPFRPIGIGNLSMCCPRIGSFMPSSTIAVIVLPGATAFRLMPRPIHSSLTARPRSQRARAILVAG